METPWKASAEKSEAFFIQINLELFLCKRQGVIFTPSYTKFV